MATLNVGGAHSTKKSLDAEVALIPAVDLLFCVVMFLLMCSVWNQLGTVETSQTQPGDHAADSVAEDALRYHLHISNEGYRVASSLGDSLSVPKLASGYDLETLHAHLQRMHQQTPNHSQLLMFADEDVPYEALIGAMDVARGGGFYDLQVVERVF